MPAKRALLSIVFALAINFSPSQLEFDPLYRCNSNVPRIIKTLSEIEQEHTPPIRASFVVFVEKGRPSLQFYIDCVQRRIPEETNYRYRLEFFGNNGSYEDYLLKPNHLI